MLYKPLSVRSFDVRNYVLRHYIRAVLFPHDRMSHLQKVPHLCDRKQSDSVRCRHTLIPKPFIQKNTAFRSYYLPRKAVYTL